MTPFPRERYEAARAEETSARNLAFLDIAEDVCGVAVRPMTLRDVIALDGIASPFMVGGRMPDENDVVVFLWFMSPKFKPSNFATWKFSRSCRGLNYLKTIDAIRSYIDAAFMDSPGGSEKARESYYSFAAALVDALSSEYGWTESEVMRCPLKRLFQYLNAMRRRTSPKAILFNPLSGEVKRQWLVELNETRN